VIKKLLTTRNIVILLLIIAIFAVSNFLGLDVAAPSVSLAAEPIFYIGSFPVTNALLTTWLVMLFLILVAWWATRRIPKDIDNASNAALVPSGLQNIFEMIVETVYGLSKDIGGRWAPRFFPIVMTLFLLVLFSNWSGLLPGVGSIGKLEHPHDPTEVGFVVKGRILTGERAIPGAEVAPDEKAVGEHAEEADAHGEASAAHGAGYNLIPFFRAPSTDLNFTLALALLTVFLTQYFGVKAAGLGYFRKFFDLSGFKKGLMTGIIAFFVSILELVSEFAKIISLAFRLFGNIFAGEILLLVIAFLIPYVVSLPFYGLEVFVGFMQALVFLMLGLVFFSLATEMHHGSGEEHH
jgi:F-type H+-transporting ATPase subunit a